MEKNNKLLIWLLMLLFFVMTICMIVGLATRKEKITKYYYYASIESTTTNAVDFTSDIIETEYNIGTSTFKQPVYDGVWEYDSITYRIDIYYLGQKDFYE